MHFSSLSGSALDSDCAELLPPSVLYEFPIRIVAINSYSAKFLRIWFWGRISANRETNESAHEH